MKTATGFLLLLLLAQASAERPSSSYIAPDANVRALIYKAPGGGEHGIHVDLYDRGQMVTGWLHSAGSAQHPAPLLRATWSPDSRFFVYTVSRSAPASARFGAFVFVRSRARVYDLANFVRGTIVESDVSLSSPCLFHTRRVAPNGKVEHCEIDLSRVEWPKI